MKDIKLGKGLKKISQACFCGCENLTEVDILSNIVTVDSFAFNDCKMLKKVIVNEGVQKLVLVAFSGCDFLKILLPSSLNEVSDATFISSSKVSKSLSVFYKDLKNLPPSWRFNKINVKDVKKEKCFTI